jgi:glycosyltransferase involved in cell wall biosynthesis
MSEQDAADRPWLSIVIPAYNEARRLPVSLPAVRQYIERQREIHGRRCEALVVDDGSTDATAAVVEQLRAEWPELRLLPGPHRGKGAAVRAGILAARGEYVALADADFSMPVEEIDHLFASALDLGDDIAVGSREAEGAHRYGEPGYRHLMGRVFNRVVQAVLLPGIEDTQCGFKALRRDVAVDVAQRQTVEGWGFDVELLYIARARGHTMREVGIDWYYMPDSRVSPLRDTLTMLRDVFTIAANARRGLYAAPTASQRALVPDKSTDKSTALPLEM